MASFVRSPITPPCVYCLRSNALGDGPRLFPSFQRQLRGKKKLAKAPSTIKVKLLEDIKGYGRNGSIIPVAPGRMRNIWYPQHKASYMTESELKELGDVVAERDFLFGMEETEARKEEEEEMVEVQMKLLAPARATEIIATATPSEIIFYRAPITTQDQDLTPESRKIVQTPDIQTLLQSSAKPKPKPIAIYGSVSTADVSEAVKSVVTQDPEGARIVLGPEDVSILELDGRVDGLEPGRIKALGSFQVEIRVKGGDSIRRTVIVKAHEASSSDSQD